MSRKSIRIVWLAGVLLMVWILAMAIPASAQQAKDKLRFRFEDIAGGTHAPYFLALERGYYAQEGIDLELAEGQGSATQVKLISQGMDVIGIADLGTMTQAVAKGFSIKAIFGVMQRSPMTIVSRADNPIKTPKDLEGKMIGMSPTESTAVLFPTLLKAAGVDRGKINIVNPAYGAKTILFLRKKVDAITAYSNIHIPQLEREGDKNLVRMDYADLGVGTLSNSIVANTDFLKKNGPLVERFLRATRRGWVDAIKDPEAAVDAIFKRFPAQSHLKDLYVEVLKQTIPLLETPNTKGKPLGWMSEEDWRRTQDVLGETGTLEKKLPLSTYYTNEFIR